MPFSIESLVVSLLILELHASKFLWSELRSSIFHLTIYGSMCTDNWPHNWNFHAHYQKCHHVWAFRVHMLFFLYILLEFPLQWKTFQNWNFLGINSSFFLCHPLSLSNIYYVWILYILQYCENHVDNFGYIFRYQAIKKKFDSLYGVAPLFYCRAPGRVNIIGNSLSLFYSFFSSILQPIMHVFV